MKLSEAIVSHLNCDHVYGNAGDEVKVISISGNTAIVEGIDKNRFPVAVGKLTEDLVNVAKELSKEVLTKQIIKPVPKRSKIKATTVPQNTLF